MNTTELKEKARNLKQTEPELYWFVNSCLIPEVTEWRGTKVDQRRKNVGNLFSSQEAAKEKAMKVYEILGED